MSKVTILPDLRRIDVEANGTGGLGSTGGAVVVSGMPRNYYTPGHDYVFVVTGQVGAITHKGPPTTFRSSAEVWCGLSSGTYFGQRHRCSLFDPTLYGGDATKRAHSFMLVLGVGSIPADTDFLVYSRVWNQDGAGFTGAFQIDALTIVAYDLSILGSANYRFAPSSFPQRPLNYLGGQGDQILRTPAVGISGDWLVYFNAIVAPGAKNYPWNAWLEHLTQDAWGPTAVKWGEYALGSNGRGGGNDWGKEEHSMGLWGVFSCQANHSFGVRARSFQWIWQRDQNSAKSMATGANIFAVRVGALPGFQFEQALERDVYAEGTGYESRREWHQPRHMPGAVMVSGCPASPGKSFSSAIYFSSKRVTADDPLSVYVHSKLEGIPEQRAGESPFFRGPNAISLIGERNPLDIPWRITRISLTGPAHGIVGIQGMTTHTRIKTGIPHGMIGDVVVTLAGTGGANLDGKFPFAKVAGPDTIDISVPKVGAYNGQGTLVESGRTFLSLDNQHGIPIGSEREVFLESVANNVPPLLGTHTARWATDTQVSIGVVSTTPGRNGSLRMLDSVYPAKYWCMIGMALNDEPDVILRSKEIPGPEIQIVPAREAPNIFALPDSPYPPQNGVGIALEASVGELRNAYGDVVTWPLATRISQTVSLRWTLPRAEAEQQMEFLLGLGSTAFRTVLPKEEPGGGPSAFVLIGNVVHASDGDAGQHFTIAVDAAKLEWIGP